jgi:hypothetical protein
MSEITKQHIQIAARLYECQKAAKGLYREKYQDLTKKYAALIKSVAFAKNMDGIHALLFLLQDAEEKGNGGAMMLLNAAFVEMTEGFLKEQDNG